MNLQAFVLRCTLLLVMCSATPLLAQDFERYRPLQPVAPVPQFPRLEEPLAPVEGSDKVLLQKLEALVVLDRADKVVVEGTLPEATGLIIQFDRSRSLVYSARFEQIVNRYLGQSVSLRSLNQLSRDIILFYRENGQPVIDVVIPEQKISQGTVQIVVIEARIHQVRIQDGCFFDACDMTKWIECTRRGGAIYEPWLEDDLFWLNQSPFRRVGLDLKPGSVDGTTDVIFTTEDVFPARFYMGYDDTGVESLGISRLNAGFFVGNLFTGNDSASYQYTTDADFRRLHAHAATYTNHINRNYSFLTYGSWAGVEPDLTGGFGQKGESWQTGFAFIRNLEKNRWVDENLSVGFDFKATNNNLEFGGTNVQNSEAELAHLRVVYNYFERECCDQYTRYGIEGFMAPGRGFTSQNTAAAFSTIRADTSPTYFYVRARYDEAFNVGDNWQAEFRSVGQLSSDRLLFSEMLGFGGYDSIRGYDQRTANGDHGWLASLEFGPRPLHFCRRGEQGRLRMYSFVDAGQAFIEQPQPGENGEQTMVSVGVGARMSLGQSLTARIDYGHGFNEVVGFPTSDRLHLGLIWQFGPLPQ